MAARPDNERMEATTTQTVTEEDATRADPASDQAGAVQDERGLRFEDPYWDDAFCAWWDPTLRTCC